MEPALEQRIREREDGRADEHWLSAEHELLASARRQPIAAKLADSPKNHHDQKAQGEPPGRDAISLIIKTPTSSPRADQPRPPPASSPTAGQKNRSQPRPLPTSPIAGQKNDRPAKAALTRKLQFGSKRIGTRHWRLPHSSCCR
jgi:hypothetical protein